MGACYDALRRRRNLEQAARTVCQKAEKSRSPEIRREAGELTRHWTSRVEGLERNLREGRFRFSPQRAVFIPRPGRRPRPIIIAPISNRIVQRAILQVLREVPGVAEILAVPWSVGGIEGIDSGIALIKRALSDGATWYLRADIPNFFSSIPRTSIADFVEATARDRQLTEIFERATETTLINASQLSEDEKELLPDEETGVAQGSALSTLVGNILLKDFDRQMQGRGVTCVRYIDDFILLGHRRAHVMGAFETAKEMLMRLGLKPYQPGDGSGKAAEGAVADGIDFLGCRLVGSLVQPGKKARDALLDQVRQILADGRQAIRSVATGGNLQRKRQREAQTLAHVNLVVKGWGEAFAFCNSEVATQHLDEQIVSMVTKFREQNSRLAAMLPAIERGRVFGVTRLSDIGRTELRVSPRLTQYLATGGRV